MPELTLEQLKMSLVDAFSQVYGMRPRRMEEGELPVEEIERLTERFASDAWKYGRKMPFDYEFARRFGWGDIQLQLHVKDGIVLDAAAYSDAMDPELIGRLPETLKGCVCGRGVVRGVEPAGRGISRRHAFLPGFIRHQSPDFRELLI